MVDRIPKHRAILEDVGPPTGLILDDALRTTMLTHLRATLPQEGCGLLATVPGGAGEPDRAMRFFPGTNVDASPTRYTMDPVEVIAAFREMEGHGWRLGAIVHSHPRSPAAPSATDRREAHYPEALMLIVSFAIDPPALRAWQIGIESDNAALIEVPILPTDNRAR